MERAKRRRGLVDVRENEILSRLAEGSEENDPSGPYSNGKWSKISCWQPLAGTGANALLRLSSKRGPQLSLLTLFGSLRAGKGKGPRPLALKFLFKH